VSGAGEAGTRGAGWDQSEGERLEAQGGELRADGGGGEEVEAEVQALLQEAARVDAEEDGKYGKGKRGDELPAELARQEKRLEKIREAKAALEQEAREAAAKKRAEVEAQIKEREKHERERGRKFGGRPPQAEWQMICATHNLLKLFRSGWSPQRA
jgi:hypothetical protein